jgi:A/G-specific adenine glycosylase
MNISSAKKQEFQKMIWDFYAKNKREMPWRHTSNDYYVLLSEIMLQQTQVPRVMTKFAEFIEVLPNFKALATSPLQTLLGVWQGMGYNRRALYLQKTAQIIVNEHNNTVPRNPSILETFPGIGKATAASIVVYTYNLPFVFIETNIRRIYIHHFFHDEQDIDDKQLYPLVAATMDMENPRDWYYALMDYGSQLPKQVVNPNRRSKHYVVQSPLEGSDRQIRGLLLKHLLTKPMTAEDAAIDIAKDENRVKKILGKLQEEGFVMEEKGIYRIK